MAKIFFSDIQSVNLNYHTPSHILNNFSFHRGWETQDNAGKRKEVDERLGSSLTEKWGQLKNITEELVDDMAEIRQEER